MRERFGTKIYKLSLDIGSTCPNRDGTIGTHGCIFCLNGSGSFAERGCDSLDEQIENAKKRVEAKNKDGKYMAYFQSYTNTYGNIERLKKYYNEVIARDDIIALSIATRPDCISREITEYLAEINKIKPVIIELGLQTIHKHTAEYIRRGYDLSVFDESMIKLKNAGIDTVVHVIAGLPGETEEDFYETVKYVAKSGAYGIKIQLLHVLSGTDLADDYHNGNFNCLSEEQYVKIVAHSVELLPRDMVVMRLTGDGDKKNLIAPLWSADKKRVLNSMKKYFEENDVTQGRCFDND